MVSSSTDGGGISGLLIAMGILLLIVIALMIFYFGTPMIRVSNPVQPTVAEPQVKINLPARIDVNVK